MRLRAATNFALAHSMPYPCFPTLVLLVAASGFAHGAESLSLLDDHVVDPIPAWAFPGAGPQSPTKPPRDELLSVRGSSAQFTRAHVEDPFGPPDWRPELHGPPPSVVVHGRAPKLYACGYCHLPDGSGRPENASLCGLPAAYIEQQVAAMAAGQRRSAFGDSDAPSKGMGNIAREATRDEVAAAAAYFASVRVPPKQTVKEVNAIPAWHAAHYIHILDPGAAAGTTDARLIEPAEDVEAHERRDPRVGYVLYVPAGSIERGRQLATAGPSGPATSCFVCHGPALKGAATAPPLAGQFGAYVLRQLLAFQSGSRASPAAAPMKVVVAHLTLDDMVALSAYIASRER